MGLRYEPSLAWSVDLLASWPALHPLTPHVTTPAGWGQRGPCARRSQGANTQSRSAQTQRWQTTSYGSPSAPSHPTPHRAAEHASFAFESDYKGCPCVLERSTATETKEGSERGEPKGEGSEHVCNENALSAPIQLRVCNGRKPAGTPMSVPTPTTEPMPITVPTSVPD